MAKSRKRKQPAGGTTLISIHFARVPDEGLDIQFALEDLVDDAGEVRGSREGADGEFDTDGEGWGYEVLVHDPAAAAGWADRLAAELPALLQEFGEAQSPWLEVVLDRKDAPKTVLRRIDLGAGGSAEPDGVLPRGGF